MTGPSRSPWTRHLPGASIARALRADRGLAIAFCVLACGALAPLFATPLLPFPDLPPNVAGASLLVRTALHQAGATAFYRIDWFPFPYWTAYLLLGIPSVVVGPFLAAKLLVAVVVLMLPLSLLRLALALGRDPRLSLWGFLLSWNQNVFAGWHAYALGMAIGFVVLAKVLEAGDEPRAAVRAIPWSLLLALTHAMAVLFVAVAAVPWLVVPRATVRRAKTIAIGLSGSGILGVTWIVGRILRRGGTAPWQVQYPTASEKVAAFFGYSLDNLRGPFGEVTGALAFVLLVLGPVAFACSRAGEWAPRDDGRRWAGATIALAALLLYAGLPLAIFGPISHFYTYFRYASYLLAVLPLVPPVQKIGAAWLAPVLAIALAANVATVSAFAGFGARVRPFLEIVDAVPAGTRLLPLEFVNQDPAVKALPLAHVHGYVTAKGAYDPHMFDSPDTPIRYREGLDIPTISWGGPQGFTLAKYGPHYDYILVQGLAADPLAGGASEGGYRVRLVREAGIWRLYAVDKE